MHEDHGKQQQGNSKNPRSYHPRFQAAIAFLLFFLLTFFNMLFLNNEVVARSQYGSTNFSGCQLIRLIRDRQCIGSKVDRSICNAHQLANCLFYVIGASRTMHVQHGKRLFL